MLRYRVTTSLRVVALVSTMSVGMSVRRLCDVCGRLQIPCSEVSCDAIAPKRGLAGIFVCDCRLLKALDSID